MPIEKAELTGSKKTLLFTLYGRALDYRSPEPILGGRWADEVLRAYGKVGLEVRMTAGDRFVSALRAKRMDGWTREFLAARPDAVVLHLACGLDSRVFRIDPPASVSWYDLDFPEVVELRRKLYPERDNYQLIASSVTEPDWLEQIPDDRPTLVIAEGLLMYLTESDVRQLLQRLTDRFPYGEMLFDVMSSGVAKFSRLFGYKMWSLDDPREPERQHPTLTLVDDGPAVADYAQIPSKGYRAHYGMLSKFTMSHNMIRPLRFRFE